MTISCRTNCGEQIEYQAYDFPDGYVYYLPRNVDGTVHNCPNLPEDGFYGKHSMHHYEDYDLDNKVGEEIVNEAVRIIERTWGSLAMLEDPIMLSYRDKPPEQEEVNEARRALLTSMQTRCSLLPAPFMIWDFTEFLPMKGDPDYETAKYEDNISTDLEWLAGAYEKLGMLLHATVALHAQNDATYDKMRNSRILELTYRYYSITSSAKKSLEYGSVENLQKNLRKVENLIKEFIRSQYNNIEILKEEFPQACSEALKNQKKGEGIIKKQNNDLVENLTFGNVFFILKTNKNKKVKKEELTKNVWKKIKPEIITLINFSVEMRNVLSHYSDDVEIEKAIDEDTRKYHIIHCEKIIEFFEKLKLV